MQHDNIGNIIHIFNTGISLKTIGKLSLLCGNLYISSIFTRCVFFNNMGKSILNYLIKSIMLRHHINMQMLKV